MRHCFEQPDLPLHAFRKALGKNRPETLEGGKGGSAPAPPDPYAVAGATTQTNESTAAYNKALNLNNNTNPFGSQQTVQVGTDPATGAPIYNTNISANPQLQQALGGLLGAANSAAPLQQYAVQGQQGLQGSYTGVMQGLGSLQGDYYSLGKQLDPNAAKNAQAQGQNAAYASQTQYLDPQFSQQQTSLESQLANQGLTPGSAAYTNAMTNFNNAKQNAYSNAANQAILTGSQIGTQNLQNQISGISTQAGLLNDRAAGYGQMDQTLGAQGNLFSNTAALGQMPISSMQGLFSLVPGYTGTGQSAASPANIGQNIYSNYQGALNNYNASTASSNSMMGGLFGLGSAAILGMAMSDRRLKTDIVALGPLKDGVNFYRYRYRTDAPGTVRYGVMADEVRRVKPDAVVRTPSGFDAVNYDRALGG